MQELPLENKAPSPPEQADTVSQVASIIENHEPISESQKFDSDIIKQILEGDKEKFALLQKKYHRPISSLLRRMIRDTDDAEDILQDTFVKVYRALATYQTQHSFEKWIYKIASNSCIDYLRRKRFQMISLDKPVYTSDGEMVVEYEDPNSVIPDSYMLEAEKSKVVQNAINSLPAKYYEVIQLRHFEELDYNEISERLNLPLGTVKAHIFRARQMMLKYLQDHRYLFQDK